MTFGCLLITNNVVAAHEDEFNAWYQEEHLDDRLGVAGFLSARRYRTRTGPQRYAATYETASSEVLRSPTYAALLAAPSPRTRAMMPHFRDVTRVIGRSAYRRVKGIGGTLALVFLGSAGGDEGAVQRLGALVDGIPARGLLPEAVRVVVVEPDPVGVSTPESKLRPTPDRRADAVLMVEYLVAGAPELADLHARLAEAGWSVENDRGGLYDLICLRTGR